MTIDRRLVRLERALPPTRAVLLWFEAANQHPNLVAYARFCLDQDDPTADLSRLRSQVVTSVSGSFKGTTLERARATRMALRDAAFLYQLLLTLNESLGAFAEIAGLRSLVLVGELGGLLADPLSEDEAARLADPNGATALDSGWRSWREAVEALVGEVRVEQLARAALDDRYFAGRSVLLSELADDWSRVVEQATRLEELVAMLREPFRWRAGMGPGWVSANQPEAVATRAGWLARRLIDAARIGAFTFLGNDDRARVVAERQLRT